ncbi:MAG: succinylglutamate desuccinylase/aspartoacylase family protein [Methanobrevibacter sp.]|jgi:predicted deacylase|nr:succinylglutamate desuccinylase/aspartoacylase family protein [Candidatus Methanovirga basalitermitum]
MYNFKGINSLDNIDSDALFPYSGGFVSANRYLFKYIPKTPLSRYVLKEALEGTSIFKFGSGDLKLMLVSGVHGNEIPPQIASLLLMEKLFNNDLNETVYIIPFTAPKSSMQNIRWFNNDDLNRSSASYGTLTNTILKKAHELKIDSLADFHSTSVNSNPGKEGVFCSLKTLFKSYEIGEYISNELGSEIISFNMAGSSFKGALEDECNLSGIPAVTCEVLSPHGYAEKKACSRSLKQMEAFLSYFNVF